MIEQLKDKIEKMKALIFEHSQYLATIENHQYLPLKNEELIQFEENHQIELPMDYRAFLLHMGNGGLGPGLGILPLDLTRKYNDLHLPWTNPKIYNALFLHDDDKEDEDEFDERVDDLLKDNGSKESQLFNAKDHGVLPIANMGCGTTALLVLNGKHKGQIWIDLTATDAGLSLLAENFIDWYNAWLDERTEKILAKNLAVKKIMAFCESSSPKLDSTKALHEFMGKFLDVRDKETVHVVLERLLKSSDLDHHETTMPIIHYLTEHEQFTNYPLAIKYIDRALDTLSSGDDASRKSLLGARGKAHAHIKQYKKAISCFNEALAIDVAHCPKGTLTDEYIRLLAFCHLCLGDLPNTKAVLAANGMANAVSLLTDLYEDHQDYELARLWGQELLGWSFYQNYPYQKSYVLTINIHIIYSLIQLKDDAQLEENLKKLDELEVNPEHLPYAHIALKLYEQKYYQKALLYLKKYESLDSAKDNHYWIYNLKGCCYNDMGMYEKGISFFWKSFNLQKWIVPYSNLIRPYINLGKFDEAQRVFNGIMAADPYYSWNYYQFSLFYLKTNKPHKAVSLLNKSIELGFDKKIILEDVELKDILKHL